MEEQQVPKFGLYRIEVHKVMGLTTNEVSAVFQHSDVMPLFERSIAYDFDDPDPDEQEQVNALRQSVRPEVFEKIKQLADDGYTFVID